MADSTVTNETTSNQTATTAQADVGAQSGEEQTQDELLAQYKQALEDLRAQSDLTQAIADSLGEGLYVLDRHGRLTFINLAGQRMLGWTEAELFGKDMHAVIHHQHADGSPFPHEECPLTSVMRSRIGVRAEHDVFVRKDGTYLPVTYVSSPILSRDTPDSAVAGAVVAFHDISRDVRAKRRLSAQYRVSRVLLESRGLEAAAPALLAAIGEDLEWDLGALWMHDPETKSLRVIALWHAASVSSQDFETFAAATRGEQFAKGTGLPGRVWAGGGSAWVETLAADTNFPRLRLVGSLGLCSAFAFPIRGPHGVLGAVEFFSRQTRSPDLELQQATSALGNQIGQFVEHHRAEAATRASEARMRAIAESALDCVVTIDAEGRFLEFNPAAERVFGYRRDEVLGRWMPELIIPPRLRQAHTEGLARYLATGEGALIGRRVEVMAMRADGSEFPVELAITRIEGEGPPLFTAYLRDITSRREAERERERLLRSAQVARAETAARAAELEATFQAMAEGVFVCDAQGQLTQVNTTGAALFGLTPGQALRALSPLGRTPMLRNPDGSPLAPDEYPLALALAGQTQTGLLYTIRPDVTPEVVPAGVPSILQLEGGQMVDISIRVSCAPVYTDGHITGAVAVASDVTELYRLERQKDEFMSIASHELKTPLTSLKILAQLLRRRFERITRESGSETPQFDRMDRAIERMERLINDLLDVTRIEAGKLALNRERVDLASIARHVAEEQAAATERQVVVEAPHDPVMVNVDMDRIAQVLANLISNALKYSLAQEPVDVRLAVTATEALLAVHDRGPGIPPEAEEHIFERFYRVPGVEVLSGSGVGLGLGLYISHEIVGRHGGRIWVESEPGEGTTFIFALPLVGE